MEASRASWRLCGTIDRQQKEIIENLRMEVADSLDRWNGRQTGGPLDARPPDRVI